jgi:GLPGLI family protein
MISPAGIKRLVFLVLCLFHVSSWAQVNTTGKITYERRTNLMKKYNNPRMKRFVNEDNKIKNEEFTLTFNDSISYFKPVPTNTVDEMAWMTTKNQYYQFLNQEKQVSILSIFGQDTYIRDSLPLRPWKITDSKRVISGYNCRKAIYQKNDSTRIYAWYTTSITPSVGPEGFCGLPGLIMGIATEDGGIIYFAKKVELLESIPAETFKINPGKNKYYTMSEFRAKIEKEYGNTPWGKSLFGDLFRWL